MPITEINLPLNTAGGWLDTGIVLPVATSVTFEASGQGTFDPLADEYAYPEGMYTGDTTGGHANLPLLVATDFNIGDPDDWLAINPNFPAAPVNPSEVVPLCLVGVVRPDGDGAPVTQVNDAIRINRGTSSFVLGPGRLFLAFNDQVGAEADNTGSFDVTVTYAPPPVVLEALATPTFVSGKPALTIQGV